MIEKLQLNPVEQKNTWDGKPVTFQTGLLAQQTDGAVVVSHGDTTLVVTSVINTRNPDPQKTFIPLAVDFRETFYATGKIGGGRFLRKEARPSNQAILYSRLIDRSFRPMFPEGMTNEMILTLTAQSVDMVHMPDIIGIIGASLAFSLAWVPFVGPIGAVRIGYLDGEYIINPTYEQKDSCSFDLVVAGSKDTITMVEAGWDDAPLDVVLKAFDMATVELGKVCAMQEEFLAKFDIEKKELTMNMPSDELLDSIRKIMTEDKMEKFYPTGKMEFNSIMDGLEDEVTEALKEELDDSANDNVTKGKLNKWVFKVAKEFIRKKLLVEGKRVDGRALDEIRNLYTDVGIFKRNHGSGLFQRGETQVLGTTTLGAPGDTLMLDTMEHNGKELSFMHHYFMLPYSTNEARMYRWQSRREIGHGRLAEKTIEPILPNKEEFPYTIRVVSEIMSCNGSTSMGAVCAACLSLMDAWVPIKKPVSGIAMGLVIGKDGGDTSAVKQLEDGRKYAVLTDIQWLEDFTGDMDFKVSGPATGINALQMDMKIKGLPTHVLKEALEQAFEAKKEILDFMLQSIPESRKELNEFAPRIISYKIDPSVIKNLIGPGGSNIQEIIRETEVSIDIDDDGLVMITSSDAANAEEALVRVKASVWTPTIGEIIDWVITRVEKYGVFVKLSKNVQWLCHVSKLGKWFIQDPSALFKIGDKIRVKISDMKDGKVGVEKVD